MFDNVNILNFCHPTGFFDIIYIYYYKNKSGQELRNKQGFCTNFPKGTLKNRKNIAKKSPG